jgi:hypothetical protein
LFRKNTIYAFNSGNTIQKTRCQYAVFGIDHGSRMFQFCIPKNHHPMNKIPHRLFIYPKDVENISGRGIRTCRLIIQKIRKYYNKKPGAPVTIKEFCEFMNIKEELLKEFLID